MDRHRQKAMNAYLGKFKEREMKTTVKHVGSDTHSNSN